MPVESASPRVNTQLLDPAQLVASAFLEIGSFRHGMRLSNGKRKGACPGEFWIVVGLIGLSIGTPGKNSEGGKCGQMGQSGSQAAVATREEWPQATRP